MLTRKILQLKINTSENGGPDCHALLGKSKDKFHHRTGHEDPDGARWGWVVNATPRPLYAGEDPVPIVQEAGWVPGPVWTGAENLTSTGIRTPDRPARSKSLCRPRYPGPTLYYYYYYYYYYYLW